MLFTIDGITVEVPVLIANNWKEWSDKARILLLLKGLYDIVSGDEKPPELPCKSTQRIKSPGTTPDPDIDTEHPSYIPLLIELKSFNQRRQMALGYLLGTMNDALQSRFNYEEYSDPAKLWERVKEEYKEWGFLIA